MRPKLRNKNIIAALFLLFLTVVACTDNRDAASEEPDVDGRIITLTLFSGSMQGSGVSTRSSGKAMELVMGQDKIQKEDATTRVMPADEGRIADFNLFLFSGSADLPSDAKLTKREYISGKTEAEVAVGNADFLYVCANVGDITEKFKVGSTYQSLLDATQVISGGQSTFETSLPMSGVVTSLVNTNVKVPLTRMVAQITFNCNLGALPPGDTFVITGAMLYNVPKSISYGIPAITQGSTDEDYEIYEGTGTVLGNTTTYTWYMPENKKKSDKTISDWQERFLDNAPAYGTYIKVTGDYTTGGEENEVSYIIYLGNGTDVNNYEVLRNHRYTVTSTIKGMNREDKRVIVVESSNLSAKGFANCYLAAKDNKVYKFNGTVKGNGNATDYAKAQYGSVSMLPASVNIDKADIAGAFMVWETAKGIIQEISWDADFGYVRFKTGTVTGNALVAVHDSSEKILWSWHIWRTNGVDLKALNSTYAKTIYTNTARSFCTPVANPGGTAGYRSLVVMDRNLGSAFVNAFPTYAECSETNCLHYQYGRKDPFPSGKKSSAASGNNGIEPTLYTYRSLPTDSKTGRIIQENVPSNNAATMIANTIMYPEKFYIYGRNANEVGYNWISTNADVGSNDWKISNCLWGDNNLTAYQVDTDPWDGDKTIYDPCPAGWRVAPADIWTGIAKTDVSAFDNLTSSSTYLGSTNNFTSNIGYTFSTKENGTGTSSVDFYIPASGYRRSHDGLLWELNAASFTWYSSVMSTGSVNGGAPSFVASKIKVTNGSYRLHALPVRCVQESSVPK